MASKAEILLSQEKKALYVILQNQSEENDLLECIAYALESANEDCKSDNSPIISRHTIRESEFNSKFKILVVEDNFINQKLIVKMLNNVGLNCDVANNGVEAIESYKKRRYDLILMDCQMPIMDGYEATNQIRIIEDTKKIIENKEIYVPIIATTAHALDGDADKCINAGMDDYLSKPIDRNKLVEVINQYLNPNETDSEIDMNEIINEISEKQAFHLKKQKNCWMNTLPYCQNLWRSYLMTCVRNL
ncbi:MAG: response regulator [Desulfosudis oleivorans]|nr:response regulator [Desulfosudis oleivorans]